MDWLAIDTNILLLNIDFADKRFRFNNHVVLLSKLLSIMYGECFGRLFLTERVRKVRLAVLTPRICRDHGDRDILVEFTYHLDSL